ncbi:MAG: DnaA N-terminal domain-containing protein [Vicinamibacterales bacterium]
MSSDDTNLWQRVLRRIQAEVDPEEFRRWFAPTSYASDSGDLITVWVPTEAIHRHISTHYSGKIERTVRALRPHCAVRFVVTGVGDEDEE